MHMSNNGLSQSTNTEEIILSLFQKLAKNQQRQIVEKILHVAGLVPWDIVTIPFKEAGKKQKISSRQIAAMIEKDRYDKPYPDRRH